MNSQVAKSPLAATVHLMPLFTLLTVPSCCPFDLLNFVPIFGFLPILSPVIAFDFGSFRNFVWQGQYKRPTQAL